jgi:AcrR family transcriptional regulator
MVIECAKAAIDHVSELYRGFYTEGIAATEVDKIVARSGVSKPTLYAHFSSNDELVAAVLDHHREERVAALSAWVLETRSELATQTRQRHDVHARG